MSKEEFFLVVLHDLLRVDLVGEDDKVQPLQRHRLAVYRFEVFDLVLVQTSEHCLAVSLLEVALKILPHLEEGSSHYIGSQQLLHLLFAGLVLKNGADIIFPAIAAEGDECEVIAVGHSYFTILLLLNLAFTHG
jgi:hypothetical protein